MKEIFSSQYQELYFTYILSEKLSKGTVILLDGLPSKPSSKIPLMKELSSQGYNVFFPRYEGTWESKGIFLERSPSEAIIEFIKSLKKGKIPENEDYVSEKIFLLGASFGGGVALDIAGRGFIDKICVVSPVISFKDVKGIDTLEGYLKEAYSKEYRFNSEDWNNLIEDNLLKLDQIEDPFKILVITGKNDNEIKERDIVEFGENNNIKVKIYNLNHISLSKIPRKMLIEITNFFSEK